MCFVNRRGAINFIINQNILNVKIISKFIKIIYSTRVVINNIKITQSASTLNDYKNIYCCRNLIKK